MEHVKWADVRDQVKILNVYESLAGPIKGSSTARGVLVRCLAGHSDSSPSMHLREDDDHFRSFCCGARGDALDLIQLAGEAANFREAIGYLVDNRLIDGSLTRPDISYISLGNAGGRRSKLINAVPTGHYDYTDENSTVLYRVVRMEGTNADTGEPDKNFDQYHPDQGDEHCAICTLRLTRLLKKATDENWTADGLTRMTKFYFDLPTDGIARSVLSDRVVGAHPGVFRMGSAGIRRVPYRLPKLIAARERGETIFFVEGEKKVHALERLGLTATSAANGSQWRMPPEWANFFKGSPVVIIPDCDPPGRIDCARPRALTLRLAGVKTQIFDLGIDRPKGYDIADWCDERAHLSPADALHDLRSLWDAQRIAMKTPVAS